MSCIPCSVLWNLLIPDHEKGYNVDQYPYYEREAVHRDQRRMRDPINEEIHKYRQEHARKFNFDLDAICKDLKERSRNLKVVRLPAKRIGGPKRGNKVRP